MNTDKKKIKKESKTEKICYPHIWVKEYKWSSVEVCSKCGAIKQDF